MSKKKNLIIVLGFFLFCSNLFANPFRNNSPEFSSSTDCQFQEVYSSYKSEFIWYNILKKLFVKLEDAGGTNEFSLQKLSEAMDETLAVCGQGDQRYYNIGSLEGVSLSPNGVTFHLFSKQHLIEIKKNGVNTSFVYQQWNDSLDQYVTYMHSRKQLQSFMSHRVLGRLGSENLNIQYYFLYSGNGQLVDQSEPISLSRSTDDFKTLADIYGFASSTTEVIKNPKVVVGVIGTGVDYNHPMIAKHLLGRDAFDDQVKGLVEMDRKILTFPYASFSELKADMISLRAEKQNIGFPVWMDQALSTHRPFDQLIPEIQGRDRRHETTMAGRIIVNQGDVGLVSVRKAYLYSGNEDLLEIFRNFDEKGVDVVNLSYAYGCGSGDDHEEQWREVFTKYPNIIVVAAAGNDGKNINDEPYCPAKYSSDYNQVVSVTAVGVDETLASYNNLSVNYGTNVTVAAHADNLLTLHPFGETAHSEEYGGSSMATAETSRILVEALEKGLNLTGQNVKQHLEAGVVPNASLVDKVSVPGVLNQDRFEQSLLQSLGR